MISRFEVLYEPGTDEEEGLRARKNMLPAGPNAYHPRRP